jgi:amino acid transporter
VFSGSRVLVGLANDGFAPKLFKGTSKSGVPYAAVVFTSVFGLLGLLNVSSGSGVVFNWLLNIAGVAGFIAWACIGISHIAFMRALEAQGISRDSLPYKAVLQPYLTWYGIGFNVIIVITQGFQAFMPWSVSDFFAAYISLILFIALYVGHKVWTRCSFVKPIDANLDTGMEEATELHAHGTEPKA